MEYGAAVSRSKEHYPCCDSGSPQAPKGALRSSLGCDVFSGQLSGGFCNGEGIGRGLVRSFETWSGWSGRKNHSTDCACKSCQRPQAESLGTVQACLGLVSEAGLAQCEHVQHVQSGWDVCPDAGVDVDLDAPLSAAKALKYLSALSVAMMEVSAVVVGRDGQARHPALLQVATLLCPSESFECHLRSMSPRRSRVLSSLASWRPSCVLFGRTIRSGA